MLKAELSSAFAGARPTDSSSAAPPSQQAAGGHAHDLSHDALPLWRALCDDSGAGVVVLDTRMGRALAGNARFARFFALGAPDASVEDLTTRSWSDVAPDAHAQDMMDRARLAAQTGECTSVRSIWRGEALLTIYRPLDSTPGPGASRVLVTVRFLGATAQTAETAADVVAGPRGPVDLGRLACLTAREREVVVLIAQGLSTHEIAAKLHRTQKTVEAHRNSIGNKLGIKNRVQLALLALGAGLETL